MPADFRFDGEPELILPLRIDRGRLIPGFRLLGVARMKPGVTLSQANADARARANAIAGRLQVALENTISAGPRQLTLMTLRGPVRRFRRPETAYSEYLSRQSQTTGLDVADLVALLEASESKKGA